MKQIAPNLFSRGKFGSIYLRLRIPKDIRSAYPAKKTHKVECLGTCDLRIAEGLKDIARARIRAEFEQHRKDLQKKRDERSVKRFDKMSDEMLKSLADYWVHQVLATDENYREHDSEEEFEEKGFNMTEQRAELGRMLAMRRSDKILPAMHSFIHLCGLEVEMSPEESKRAGGVFLTAVCTALDFRLQRQQGQVVQTDVVAPPALAPREVVSAQEEAQSKKNGWDDAFVVWRDYVPGRPKSTAINEIASTLLKRTGDALYNYATWHPEFVYNEKRLRLRKPLSSVIENVGSSSNHMFMHLLHFLSLHAVALVEKSPFIPAFLIIDQPSRPYYPSEVAMDGVQLKSEDSELVRVAFELLDGFVKEMRDTHAHEFQMIVFEHVNADAFQGLENVHVLPEFRESERLIPESWYLGQQPPND